MNTTDFGWPMSSPVTIVGSKIFLEAHKGLSQGSCTNVPQPEVFTGCIKPPESTPTLAGRLADVQTSRSTKLEERAKKQSKILSDLALEVHHSLKVCKVSIVNVCCFVHAGHSPNLFHCILCYWYSHGCPKNIWALL